MLKDYQRIIEVKSVATAEDEMPMKTDGEKC